MNNQNSNLGISMKSHSGNLGISASNCSKNLNIRTNLLVGDPASLLFFEGLYQGIRVMNQLPSIISQQQANGFFGPYLIKYNCWDYPFERERKG